MYAGRAFVAGIVAAAIASGVMLLLRALGVPLDIDARLAALFGASSWIVGFALYLLIGGAIALGYATFFEWALHQAGVGPGVLVGAWHTILAGFAWSYGTDPGKFWVHFGAAGIASLFLVHFVYGGVVGGLYRTKHTLTRARKSWPLTFYVSSAIYLIGGVCWLFIDAHTPLVEEPVAESGNLKIA